MKNFSTKKNLQSLSHRGDLAIVIGLAPAGFKDSDVCYAGDHIKSEYITSSAYFHQNPDAPSNSPTI